MLMDNFNFSLHNLLIYFPTNCNWFLDISTLHIIQVTILRVLILVNYGYGLRGWELCSSVGQY